MYIELDFELSYPHPLTNQEKPFLFFCRIKYDKGEGYDLELINIVDDLNSASVEDLIEFCNPDLYKEMIEDAEKEIEKKITNGELW